MRDRLHPTGLARLTTASVALAFALGLAGCGMPPASAPEAKKKEDKISLTIPPNVKLERVEGPFSERKPPERIQLPSVKKDRNDKVTLQTATQYRPIRVIRPIEEQEDHQSFLLSKVPIRIISSSEEEQFFLANNGGVTLKPILVNPPSGSTRLELTIMPDGRVSKVEVDLGITTNRPTVNDSIKNLMAKWVYSEISEPGPSGDKLRIEINWQGGEIIVDPRDLSSQGKKLDKLMVAKLVSAQKMGVRRDDLQFNR